ncbi:MAG: ABC-type multidrug transport system, ATPase component [Microbacterium sp.]|nr:ABC-type multidrug transport system, ATPase component [Microbacterium sp.]
MTTSSTRSPAVRAEGLVKTFGSNRAVDGVDLVVEAGTVYGVLGPNGAGKTTTISMLTTLLRPDGGRAEIFGHDVAREPHVVRQLIGLTGQFASVDEKLSATENLMIFGRLLGLSRGDARRKASELLEEFGLTEAASRPLAKFSGGMRRWDTIRRLVASGSTVVLTTQYLDEADQLADRIAVIDRGRVVAEGTALELKASVGQASLVLRLQPGSDLDVARATVGRVLDATAIVSPEAARLTVPMSDPDQVTDLLVAFRDAGLHLSEFSVQQPTLDEVFLTLTGTGVPADDTAARESADDLEGVRS